MKKFILIGAITATSLLDQVASGAAITQITVSIGRQMLDFDGVTALSPGVVDATTTDHGDGAIIQLGYYTQATLTNLFAGEWVPLTGEGSRNPIFDTTVGDGINTNTQASPGNRFGSTIIFDLSDDAKDNGLPAAGQLMGVRFYNRTALSLSTHFNAISSPDWIWLPPGEPPTNPVLSFSTANVNARLQSTGAPLPGANNATAASALSTTILVPEPSSLALLMIGLASFVSNRRRTARM